MKLQFAEFWKCFNKGSCVNFLFKEVLKTLIPTFFFLLLLEVIFLFFFFFCFFEIVVQKSRLLIAAGRS